MRSIEVTEETRASTGTIWALWCDVEGSPRWDTDVQWSRLGGPFEIGTRGAFRLKGGPRVSFLLTEVRPGAGYENAVRLLPGLRVTFTHAVEPRRPSGCRVRHGARFEGPLAPVAAAILGPRLRSALGAALMKLVALAEEREARPGGEPSEAAYAL